LSNLETDKDKLLQIVLVGQLNLREILRTPELRQLDQRVSIRYQLRPLTRDETAAYVAHRLMIAGGGCTVTFTLRALHRIHAFAGGIPRLINLVCDRALLAAFSARTNRIEPQLVEKAARTLDLEPRRQVLPGWVHRRAAALAVGAAALAMAAAAFAYGAGYFLRADAPPQVPAPHAYRSPQ
jgi:general secretion pathway protein A